MHLRLGNPSERIGKPLVFLAGEGYVLLYSAAKAGLGTGRDECCSSREHLPFKDDNWLKEVLK